MLDIRRFINRNNEASHGLITANQTTAVTLVVANEERIGLVITNTSNQAVWIRFKTAATDNTKHGILLSSNEPWTMPDGSIYQGEVSVIMATGVNKDIAFLEW